MSAKKTERLLNLVICLLHTRRYLSVQEIRTAVPGYEQDTEESFRRMFERDKEELRELGIPLATEDIGGAWDDEVGYRIDQRDYALPDLDFEPDELAVLGLASRTWAHASLVGPAAQALRKLKAAGIERDGDSLVGIEPRLGTSEPAFEPVKNAVVGAGTMGAGIATLVLGHGIPVVLVDLDTATLAAAETRIGGQLRHAQLLAALPADRTAAFWSVAARGSLGGPITLRLGVLGDGVDETIDLLAHDLDEGLISAGAGQGMIRWTGDAPLERLRGLRRAAASREIPMTLERAPWPVRRALGHFGAYREGVGKIVGRLRGTFDPGQCLNVALEGAE